MTASTATSDFATFDRIVSLVYDDTVNAESEEYRIGADMKACRTALRAYIRRELLPNSQQATIQKLKSMAAPFFDDAILALINASERHAQRFLLRVLRNSYLEDLRERLLTYSTFGDVSHFSADFQRSVRAYLDLEEEHRTQQILVHEYDTLEKLLASLNDCAPTEQFSAEAQRVFSEATATQERTVAMWRTWIDRLLAAREPRS